MDLPLPKLLLNSQNTYIRPSILFEVPKGISVFQFNKTEGLIESNYKMA